MTKKKAATAGPWTVVVQYVESDTVYENTFEERERMEAAVAMAKRIHPHAEVSVETPE